MKTLSRMMLVAAASSLAIAPVAAQAGTRASEGSSVSSVSAPGKGRTAKGEKQSQGFPIVLGLLAAAAVIAGAISASSSDDKGQSPGT